MDEHKVFMRCAWRLMPFILLLYFINYVDRVNIGFAALTTAFLPLHKRAMGIAVGVAAGLSMFMVTAIYLVRDPDPGLVLHLLANYFAGYTVSWQGAFVGAAWAGFAGFVAGWFFAFARNFVMALMVIIVRTKAELQQTRDFLDHI